MPQGLAQEPTPPNEAAPAEATPAPEPAPHPLVIESDKLAADLRALVARRAEFDARIRKATGVDLEIVEEQNWRRQQEAHGLIVRLTANIVRQDQTGLDVSALRKDTSDFMRHAYHGYPEVLEWREGRAAALRGEIDNAAREDQADLERKSTREEGRIQDVYRILLEAVQVLEDLGLDAEAEHAAAIERLQTRAEIVAGRVSVAHENLADLSDRIRSSPDDAGLQADAETYQERLDRATDNLASSVSLMSESDLDTAKYQQLLIQATGEITTGIFDTQVLLGLAKSWRDETGAEIASRGASWLMRGLLFLLILLAFRVAAAVVRRIVKRSVRSSRLDLSQLLQTTLISWSARVMMAIGLLVGLSQLGVEIGPLLAGLGIAGFIVGFALQDSLANFAAGIMILVYRPFDVGDVIDASGIQGSVSDMSLVSTTFLTFDNQTLIVPNNKIWGDVIRNVTAQTIRRVDLKFHVSHRSDIQKVETVLKDLVAETEIVLADPEPNIRLHKLHESSVEFIVRPWVKTQDYWDAFWGLTREVKLRFDREGIEIPFPQRDVHIRTRNDENSSD